MTYHIKKFLFLMSLSLIVISCGGGGGSITEACNLNSDCSKTQECRFSSKTDNSGECVEKKVCQEDSECSDKRACAASLIGTEKYCGGFLSNFSFKDGQNLKSGTVDEVYNDTIQLIGQTGAFHIIVKTGDKLPDGLMINLNTGDISGTPTKEGEFKFTLIAYNGASDAKNYYNIIKVEKEFIIKINKANVCTPDCTNKVCGDDGCGGSCGTCTEGTCNNSGQCETTCTPDCTNKVCGDDGCGGSCGTCTEGTCNNSGQCETTCTPDCTNKVCGDDGCGGSCGTCTEGTCNNDSGQCETICTPSTCDDLSAQCGSIDDGCGTMLECGDCYVGSECIDNLCEVIVVINEGDIIFSEIMANPSVPDGQGGVINDSKTEWVELYNTTDHAIDLDGLKIVKGTTNYDITLITTTIESHSYYVIARKEASVSKLPIVDATGGFSLTNGGASLQLKLGDTLLDTVTYQAATEGASWQLDKDVMDFELNDDNAAWCLGTTVISTENTDLGTPALENLSCH